MVGTITHVKVDRGFGFIRPDDGGRDVFFHFRVLSRDLEFGPALQERRVEFAIVDDERGPKATNVRAVQ